MFARKSSTWFQFLQKLETEDFIFYSFSLYCLVWWNISCGEMCFTCCVRLQKVVIHLVVFAKIMLNAFTSESENHGEMWRTENHFPLEPFSSSTANALHKYATLMRFLSMYCLEDWAEDWLPLWQNNLFHCYLKYIQCVIIDWQFKNYWKMLFIIWPKYWLDKCRWRSCVTWVLMTVFVRWDGHSMVLTWLLEPILGKYRWEIIGNNETCLHKCPFFAQLSILKSLKPFNCFPLFFCHFNYFPC